MRTKTKKHSFFANFTLLKNFPTVQPITTMGFYDSTIQFNGRRVVNYDAEQGIEDPQLAYRFYTNYDNERDVAELFQTFLKDPKASAIDTLVFGLMNIEGDRPPTKVIQILAEHQEQLKGLKAVFFGDIMQEECEVSWIENCDHSLMFQAFPNLQEYRVRGGNGLSFSNLNHGQLKKLIVETGGMDSEILDNLKASQLPQLEHLELWLGSENYGFEATADEVVGAIEQSNLPQLKYLGLRNSEIADDIAKRLEESPLLQGLEVLDLSMGNLSDEGAEALLDNPNIKNLSQLLLDYHYISEDVVEQLQDLGVNVSAEDPQEADDYGDGEIYRYIAVSE